MSPGLFERKRDYCSCSSDRPFGVYIGDLCYEHDLAYARALLERDPVRRVKLRRRADVRFRNGIRLRFREVGRLAPEGWRRRLWTGKGELTAWSYFRGVRRLGGIYRAAKGAIQAIRP